LPLYLPCPRAARLRAERLQADRRDVVELHPATDPYTGGHLLDDAIDAETAQDLGRIDHAHLRRERRHARRRARLEARVTAATQAVTVAEALQELLRSQHDEQRLADFGTTFDLNRDAVHLADTMEPQP
jgi:hypothetical protein